MLGWHELPSMLENLPTALQSHSATFLGLAKAPWAEQSNCST